MRNERCTETPGARAAAASAASSSAAWPSMMASGRPSAAPPSEPEVTNISGASRDASASDPDIQKGKEKGRNAERCSTPLKVRARGTPATALRKRGECRIPGRERVKLVVLPLTCLTALHTQLTFDRFPRARPVPRPPAPGPLALDPARTSTARPIAHLQQLLPRPRSSSRAQTRPHQPVVGFAAPAPARPLRRNA